VPSDRQLIYNDLRSNATGKIPDDTWNCYSRVCGTFKEREGWHPCQMPELLLARIIAVSSNAGDLVFDPFNGSGTTAVAALQLGRDYCGTDISEDYVKNTQIRLKEIAKSATMNTGLFGSLDAKEILELKRLFAEMGFDAKTLLENEKYFNLFSRQFELRMNNGRNYDSALIQQALKELTTWVIRK